MLKKAEKERPKQYLNEIKGFPVVIEHNKVKRHKTTISFHPDGSMTIGKHKKRNLNTHIFDGDSLLRVVCSVKRPKKCSLYVKDGSKGRAAETVKIVILFEGGPRERDEFKSYCTMIQDGINRRSDQEELKIFATTWNMGDAPPPQDLSEWIPRGYDIYVIAAQEAEYSPREPFQSCEADLFGTIQQHLDSGKYIKLAGTSLWAIRLVVLVKRQHYYKISHVDKSTEATGIAHIIGNKGGVAICFDFYETSFCFVGSHLAAHQHKSDLRNSNYREIVRGINFERLKWMGIRHDILNSFDHVMWMGDLNYRIDLERDRTLELIARRDFATLYAADQLRFYRENHSCFVNFVEGHINFPPTYKYERGNREYTTDRMRVPSWCDRILWKSMPGRKLKQLSYSCADAITTSDHSPVYAGFLAVAMRPPLPEVDSTHNVDNIDDDDDEKVEKDSSPTIKKLQTPIGSQRRPNDDDSADDIDDDQTTTTDDYDSADDMDDDQIATSSSNSIVSTSSASSSHNIVSTSSMSNIKSLGTGRLIIILFDEVMVQLSGVDNAQKYATTLHFSAPFLRTLMSSSKKKKGSVSASWVGSELPELIPFHSNLKRLQQQLVFVSVKQSNSKTLDTPWLVGQGVIPLTSCWQQWARFNVSLTHGGVSAGELSGKIMMKHL